MVCSPQLAILNSTLFFTLVCTRKFTSEGLHHYRTNGKMDYKQKLKGTTMNTLLAIVHSFLHIGNI